MGEGTLFDILRDISLTFSLTNPKFKPMPMENTPHTSILDFGLNPDTLPEILNELKLRLDGRDVNVIHNLGADAVYALTLREFLKAIQKNILAYAESPIVVYVDDEEENIFIFKRYFGKSFKLKTFTDPEEAFGFIRSESTVRLVITDEVMPGLTGNALCNAIRRFKPYLKFILLTGNPSGDDNLMYKSLKQGRFHDFINKPLNLEAQGAEYTKMIRNLIEAEPEMAA